MKYIDRDKLKSHLEYLAQRDRNYAKECSDNTDFDRQRKYCFEANVLAYELCMAVMDYYIIPDVQPVDRWISCTDEMPEDGVSVLICSDRGTVSKATYDSDMGYFYIANSKFHYNELDITQWQPLPKPPKTKKG